MQFNDLFLTYSTFELLLKKIQYNIVNHYSKKQEELFRHREVYNGIIVTIYGLFENFVKETAKNYLTLLTEVNKYKDKNAAFFAAFDKILKTYKRNLGDVLSNPNRHSNFTSEDIQKFLKDFVDAKDLNKLGKINNDILLIHSHNMNSDNVSEFYNKIGLENLKSKFYANNCFRNFLNDLNIYSINGAFFKLDNLVNERNEIAHTGVSLNRTSAHEIVNVIIPYCLIFSETLCKIAANDIMRYASINLDNKFRNRSILNVYKDYVLCHNNEYKDIKLNDYFVIKNNKDFITTKILEIQYKDEPVITTGKRNKKFGFRMDEKIKLSFSLVSLVSK